MAYKIVYKITYQNKKIYIGRDVTNSINYFGSVNEDLIAQDFTWEERQIFTITREILWSSETATDKEVNRKEMDLIRFYQSHNPEVGYNRKPKWKQSS